MASFSQSTIENGSDTVQDFLCSTCKDMKQEESADFHCESCMQFYCRKCIIKHGELFIKHSPYGREDMKKWPVSKKVEDFLQKCAVHKDKNLEMYCQDHSRLCCNNCAFIDHRQCKTVTLISDYVKYNSTDLKQQSISIQIILEEMKKLQESQEACIHFVQSSYDEQLHKINETRRKINEALDRIEKKTLHEMKETLTKLQSSLKGDVDKCATLLDKLKRLRSAIQDICDKSNLDLSFIASKKCQDQIPQAEAYLKENSVPFKVSIKFMADIEIVQYLSTLSGLGTIQTRNQELTMHANTDQDDTSTTVSKRELLIKLKDVELRREQIDLQDSLGAGQFASVCRGTCRLRDGKQIPVAVKARTKEISALNQEGSAASGDLLKETDLLMSLSHKHIVRMIGVFKDDTFMLVLELAPLGPLSAYLSSHKNFPQVRIVLLLWQVAKGMEYLEWNNIVHRNLATRKVLLFSESYAKITDFGRSKALRGDNDYYEAKEGVNCPFRFYPPESLNEGTFDSASDVWSYGVTMWEATSYGKKPYEGKSTNEVVKFLKEDLRLEKPPLCEEDVYDVMLRCWDYEQKRRPKFAQLVTAMGDIRKLMLNRQARK